MSEPPSHLSAEAAAWWRVVATGYVLDQAAFLILQVVCESFDRMRQAQSAIREHGVVVATERGTLKANPAAAVERDSRAAMLQALKALHLDLEPVGDLGRPPAPPELRT